MQLDNHQYNPKKVGNFVLSFIIAFLIFWGMFFLNFFCPDFIFKQSYPQYLNLNEYLQINYFRSGNAGLVAGATLYWILQILLTAITFLMMWHMTRCFLNYVRYRPWLRSYVNEHTKIINSCDHSTFNDKVAMVVLTCNDIAPNTILQTMKQTYKNMDVWISDDSYKPEEVKLVDEFVAAHPEVKLFRRPAEHKKIHRAKVGNLFAWLDAHGSEYDYVFENDSSNLTTSTFVENCLAYYHSPILKDYKMGGIIALGGFYNFKTLISSINNWMTQFNECNMIGASTMCSGNPVYLQGWGCMYPVKALKEIDLNLIECPSDDVSRGAWLTWHGYTNWMNPFDFTGKIGIRNMDAWRAQRMKWAAADIYLCRNKINWARFKDKSIGVRIHTAFCAWSSGYLFPGIFIFTVLNIVMGLCLSINFPNMSQLVFVAIMWILVVVSFVIIGFYNRCSLRSLFGFIFSGIIELGIFFRRFFQIMFVGWIKGQWSASAVTVKKDFSTTFKQKMKMIRMDIIIILCATALCAGLHFVPGISRNMLWSSLYVFLMVPPVIYIIWIFLGEKSIKSGWTSNMVEYRDFFKFGDRYKVVSQTEMWKKQHPENY